MAQDEIAAMWLLLSPIVFADEWVLNQLAERDEVRCSALLPMWKQVFCKPNLLVGIKEARCVHGVQGVTASKPSRLPRRLGSRGSLKYLPHVFYRRTAVRDYLVVVFFEIELIAEFFSSAARRSRCSVAPTK